jgi:hypothetical protein
MPELVNSQARTDDRLDTAKQAARKVRQALARRAPAKHATGREKSMTANNMQIPTATAHGQFRAIEKLAPPQRQSDHFANVGLSSPGKKSQVTKLPVQLLRSNLPARPYF